MTAEGLINEAEQVRAAAVEAGQFSAAIAAIKEKGVLSGKRVERSERGDPGEFEFLNRLTPEELKLLAAGELDLESFQSGAGDGDADRPAGKVGSWQHARSREAGATTQAG